MKIDISDLISKKCDKIYVDENVNINSIYRGDEEIRLIKPITVKGHLYRADQSILFSGSFDTVIQTECCRCLEEFSTDISFSFDEIVFGETQEESNDIIADLDDNLLELEGFMEKLLILKLPMKFLCDNECKGLCSQCGTNLNNSECSCEKEDIDIRLIKLRELLKQD